MYTTVLDLKERLASREDDRQAIFSSMGQSVGIRRERAERGVTYSGSDANRNVGSREQARLRKQHLSGAPREGEGFFRE